MRGFPCGTSGKEPSPANAGDMSCRFEPSMEKIPWRRAWQTTPVFLPGESAWTEESGGLHRVAMSWTQLEQLSTHSPAMGRMVANEMELDSSLLRLRLRGETDGVSVG